MAQPRHQPLDPLSVAGRNHDLVLHARVAGYDPAWCDALYERRELYEAFNKGLSLVLTSDFPCSVSLDGTVTAATTT